MTYARNHARFGLLMALGLATTALTTVVAPSPALADECLLDTNNDGVPSAGDTDGGATSAGSDALACGVAADATAPLSTAVGAQTDATALAASAFGSQAIASGIASTALGHNSDATAQASTAVGVSAQATALGATSLGRIANAAGENSTAIGPESSASALSSTALGHQAIASGIASSALGHNSDATATGSTAVGVSAQATQLGATAVGRIANASGLGATALGSNAQATAANSVALGQNSVANQANTVSVGAADAERRIVNVAAGTATTDAVNLGQLNAMSSLVTNQSAAIGALQTDTVTLFDLTDRLRGDVKDANEGVAMALAMDSPSVPAGAKFALSGGIGYFKNRAAFAAAISAAVGEMSSVSAGLGYGLDSNEIGARAGFQIAW